MSFQQGLSGLNATSKSLEVIGNNIANANTYGAKASRAEFADLYAASLNGTGASSIGIGTQLAAVAQQFTQGSVTATDNPMDLAVNGRGFFRQNDPSGAVVYSRNGQFKLDRLGYVVNNQGQRLQAQPWDETKSALAGPPADIRITGGQGQGVKSGTGAAEGERGINVNMNFDSRVALGDTQINAADGTRTPFAFNNDLTYDFTFTDRVYGEAGAPLEMTYYFRKEPIPGAGAQTEYAWNVFAKIDGKQFDPVTGEVYRGNTLATPPDPAPPAAIPIATLTFENGRVVNVRDASGTDVESGKPVLIKANDPSGATLVDGTGTLLAAAAQKPLFTELPMNIWNSTQMPSTFDVSKIQQDGYEPGQLVGVSFDSAGLLQATYSNGRAKTLAQVQLFDFTNVQGLKPRGGNAWEATFASGDASIPKPPGEGGLGVLQSGALEESNIDLTAELVNMITAQRIYQANAQSIKTIDQVMQTLVNLR